LFGSHTADLILQEIELILADYSIISKVVKIVTDGGANFVCAFKTPENNAESENVDLEPISVTSLRDILISYNGHVHPIRPHQRCASHRLNNTMNADIEAARKRIMQAYNNGERDEHVVLGRSFFEQYDAILKDCHKLWNKQQRSTVRIFLLNKFLIWRD
jgi:hypothetical protein